MLSTTQRLFFVILAMLSALPPFATDTYLPAIPLMAQHFQVNPNDILITITTYFFGFTIGIIIWGPLSDLIGRKSILYIGLTIYIISSILSSHTTEISQLCFTRAIQAFGDSAGITAAFSIARDCFSGTALTKVTTTLSMMVMLAPITAPVIGTLLIQTQHWEYVFHFLTGYGVILLISVYFLPETLTPEKKSTSIMNTIGNYRHHIANRNFMLLALTLSICFSAFFSFICSSSIIYLHIYHTTEYQYCALFAFNSTAIFSSNFIINRICERFSLRSIELTGLCIALSGTLLTFILTHYFPQQFIIFTGCIFITTFGGSLAVSSLRSDAPNQVSFGYGTATSIINIIRNILASIASYSMSFWLMNNVAPLAIQQFSLFTIGLIILWRVTATTPQQLHSS